MGDERDVRPLRVAPFGARVRRQRTEDVGVVTGYLIRQDGPMEYEVRLPSGRFFIPIHEAVPVVGNPSRGAGRKSRESRSTIAARIRAQEGGEP